MNNSRNSSEPRLERQMIQLRYWQHIMNEDLKKKLFKIPIHVAFGSEAIAVSVSNMMNEDDQLVLTHRNMAYNLAREGALKRIREEYTLSPDGVSAGRLGSMNLTNPARGVVYASSILGNNFSIGCGLSLAKRVKREKGIAIVTTGDGAMEEGGFYETLVFAKSHDLKLMIVIDNNNHSMSSTIEQRRCPIAIDKVCGAAGITYKNLSTNDVFDYASSLSDLRAAIESGSGPVCVEAVSRLLNQHAGPTPGWPTDPMNVDLKNGLLIRNDAQDPLYVLRETMGGQEFDTIVTKVTSESWN